ncbi:MAG: homocysteine S-methyltransferase family protein [Acidobacteriota bacterium]|nr:MAG: homocysteine S-methyltransferase family protein [Acidobacteriota bacterium]
MSKYRSDLPQLNGNVYLADGGLETDLIFNHGIEIPEFAAHTLLNDEAGRRALAEYFRRFLRLAQTFETGFVLDTQTWKAHVHWASDLGVSEEELRKANEDSVAFVSSLRDEFHTNSQPIVLSAIVGPRGDGYAPESLLETEEAEEYHSRQLGWLAQTEVDMVAGVTFNQAYEAAGFVRAANASDLPAVISFTTETDGRLPSGQPLQEAIETVDELTDRGAEYFMVNCAHPDHFFHVLDDAGWCRRIRGLRCNASRRSHAELDSCDTLDAGDPVELGNLYRSILQRMPWLNIFGGCCGSDLRHVTQIARAVL